MKKLSFSKKLAFLGIVGGVVSAAVLAVKKFLVKVKESTVSLVQNRLRSQTQKIAPAMASTIVGIGLLSAPFESVQTQVLSPSHVTGVSVETVDLGGEALGIWRICIDFDVFDTSSDYDVAVCWPLISTPVIANDFRDSLGIPRLGLNLNRSSGCLR